MAAAYQLTHTDSVIRIIDNAWIPNDPSNRDWIEYQQWLSAGNKPDSAPPLLPLPAPLTISHRQFFQALAISGLITQDEALAAVKTGTIPAQMDQFINTLHPDEQFAARMLIAGASEFNRSHPLTEKFAEYNQMTEQQVDELWTLGAAL